MVQSVAGGGPPDHAGVITVQHLFNSLHSRMDRICSALQMMSSQIAENRWRTGLLLRGTSTGCRNSLIGMFGES